MERKTKEGTFTKLCHKLKNDMREDNTSKDIENRRSVTSAIPEHAVVVFMDVR